MGVLFRWPVEASPGTACRVGVDVMGGRHVKRELAVVELMNEGRRASAVAEESRSVVSGRAKVEGLCAA